MLSREHTPGFSPRAALKIAERYASRAFREVNLGKLLAELAEPAPDDRVPIPSEFDPKQGVADIAAIYLSALIIPNKATDLLALGRKIIWKYAAAHDVESLVNLTNSIFKSLTLSPPGVPLDGHFHRLCLQVNFELHAFANILLHSIRRLNPDYYGFAREIDAALANAQVQFQGTRTCFVFLTADYLPNFEIWLDVFSASTLGRANLLVACIGADVRQPVEAKLAEVGFPAASIIELHPSRRVTPCGNGEDLYFLWYLKIKIVRHLVAQGHDVVYSDLDSFWLKDFFRIWHQPALAGVDLAFMASTDMPPHAVYSWGSIPCCGFLACRASPRLERFLGNWERWVEVMFDDQIGLAQMLLDHSVTWREQDGSPDWRTAIWEIWPPRDHGQITLSLLNPSIARRVGSPDISTTEGATIWHPRWITSKHEHAEIAPSLVALAVVGAAETEQEPERSENLTALADRYGSDKGTRTQPAHHYTLLYDLLFADARDQPIDFLEIGLAVGGPELGNPADRFAISPSVQMWLSYFKYAKIYGFDITDFSHMWHPRFQFIQGDCGRAEDLQNILRSSSHFDIIIDDASHASFHQQNAFRELFPSLRPGGLYIIEDLHWQSPYFEDKLPPVPKTWEFFTRFFIASEYSHNRLLSAEFMRVVKSQTHSFSPFRDFTGQTDMPKIIVLKKKGVPAWAKS